MAQALIIMRFQISPSQTTGQNIISPIGSGLDYVGVGPGAHGRVTMGNMRQATIAHLTPTTYARAVTETGSGIDSLEALTGQDWAAEYLLMGLRIDEGISIDRYRDLSGEGLNSDEIITLSRDGYLSQSNDRLHATAQGRLVLNAVTERLLLN